MRGRPENILAPWCTVPQCWVDVETTGTGPDARVVQLAAVRTEGNPEAREVTGKLVTYVDPCKPIPAAATAVHGISDADVRGAPTWVDVLESGALFFLLEGAQACAYNAHFDGAFFPRRRLGACPAVLDDDRWPWLDGLTLAREAVQPHKWAPGERPSCKLAVACKRHGVELAGAHDALADATAAAALTAQLAVTALADLQEMNLIGMLTWSRKADAEHWFVREVEHLQR